MSKTRIAILGLAVGSAVLAAMLAKGVLGRKPTVVKEEVSTVETVGVLVATKNLQMGERLVAGSVDWVKWPKAMVSEPMITDLEDAEARQTLQQARARLAIFEGEPIMDKKLVQPTETGFMSAILPKGFRAISVRISEETGAGGFILPNDRVDVILTRKLDDANSSDKITASETVLTNVRVLAIDQTYRPAAEGEPENVVVAKKTATLELDPRQAEVIAMAETAGNLSLALRSIAENGDKGLDDGGPKLAEKYLYGSGGGGDFTIIKYGIEKNLSNAQ